MSPSQPVKGHSEEYISLRDYIDTCFELSEKTTEAVRLQMEKRLDGMNEFRNALRDQGFTFITKSEYNVFKDLVEKDIRSLRETRALLEGKASQASFIIALIISLIGILLGVISLILR